VKAKVWVLTGGDDQVVLFDHGNQFQGQRSWKARTFFKEIFARFGTSEVE
jgi:hypothetical protein